MPAKRVNSLDNPVSIMIGMEAIARSFLRISHTANPSNSGSTRSRTIKSGWSERTFLSASMPLVAVAIEKPAP